jgi:glycosyltransferase involved in cell wall biosynthesis
MVVLGGSLHHPGGVEAFCDRAAAAVSSRSGKWQAEWWPTDTAYFSRQRLPAVREAWRRVKGLGPDDLVWLQWSTLLDLLFLFRLRLRGVPVMVTPHLGSRSRLQRSPVLRRLSARLLARANRIGLLFDGQETEIALPAAVRRSTIGTFLPEEALTQPAAAKADKPLHLIHAGRLSAEKGAFRMVELCAALRDRQLPFSAQIIGSAEPSVVAALAVAIEEAGLAPSLTLSGWMDGPALRQALAQADVLVHLSELDSFPLIVLEALAAGAIPIVAEMAGASAMVRRYDGFVTPASRIAAAADWLVGEGGETLRRRGARASVAVREDYAWRTIVHQLERAAEAVLP